MFVIQIPSIGEWIISQSPTTCITLQVIYHPTLAIIAIVLSLFVKILYLMQDL